MIMECQKIANSLDNEASNQPSRFRTRTCVSKLKSAIKNESEVVVRLSSNMIGDDEINFLRKSLFTNRQVSNLCKAFANKSSTAVKLSKTQ